MGKENKPNKLEQKLIRPFDIHFSAPTVVEKENGLKWTEFAVMLKAKDAGYILHWWYDKIAHDFSGMSVPSIGKIPIDHVHGDEALGYIGEFNTGRADAQRKIRIGTRGRPCLATGDKHCGGCPLSIVYIF